MNDKKIIFLNEEEFNKIADKVRMKKAKRRLIFDIMITSILFISLTLIILSICGKI